MALKASVYKAELQVSDIDRGHYGSYSLTLARHPSETEERLLLRLLAFGLYADPALTFGRGISTEEEPDIWSKDDSGEIELWIDLGLPDEKRLRKAAARARHMVLFAYGDRAFEVWWRKQAKACARLPGLVVWRVPDTTLDTLAGFAARSMQLQLTVQDGAISLAGPDDYQQLPLQRMQG